MQAFTPKVYYVVFVTTSFTSFAQARESAPELIAEHVSRSKTLHQQGKLLMAGAFLDRPEENLGTMGVLVSKEDAEEYIKNDPFVVKGMVRNWYIREWANMFA